MIRSMTGYARRETSREWGKGVWELRSVNQRYLEIYIHLSEQFRSLEPLIRKHIRSRLTRGKVTCSLHFDPLVSSQGSMILNKKLANQVIEAANWVKTQSGTGDINPIEVLKWPEVMYSEEKDLGAIGGELMHALGRTLDDFIDSREREGAALRALVEERLYRMSVEVFKVRTHIPSILQWQRQRLLGKLEEVHAQIDAARLEQELILMAQRIDVSEELDRLDAHVKEMRNILKKNEAVGRHLDFMIQELNRESNTLAAKSINSDITMSAIELKVLIEQIREQIQNIE